MNIDRYYTTHEQVKELLEYGIPKNTADCYRVLSKWSDVPSCPQILDVTYDKIEQRYQDPFMPRIIPIEPCWSVGTLIDIYLKIVKHQANMDTEKFVFGENIPPIHTIIQWVKCCVMTEDTIQMLNDWAASKENRTLYENQYGDSMY